MIRVEPADEPETFDKAIRQKGLDAIRELVGEKPLVSRGTKRKKVADKREAIPPDNFPPFWRNALPDMLEAYQRRCAYLSLYIERATGNPSVDHFIPKSKAWNQVYEWSNYRLACNLMNARKKDVEGVLDPFEIEEGWFALEFVAFQVIPGPESRGSIAKRVQNTIEILKLNDEECCKVRQEYVDAYFDIAPIPLNYLERRAPFIARELRRQGLLRTGDA